MSLTKDSLVLLDKGYTSLADVRVGDICLTPLGPTQVIGAGFLREDLHVPIRITDACTFIFARRLLGLSGFHVVWNREVVAMHRQLGVTINMCMPEDNTQPTPAEIYTFGRPVLLDAPLEPVPRRIEHWALITANGIAVVGDVVIGAKQKPVDAGTYPPLDTVITQSQLEAFKHAYF